jgi:uncharacterized protein (DUF1810 family)
MSKTNTDDPHDLQRFVDAQSAVYANVCEELRDGRKRTHWMWFIFPQIAGLGRSAMAARFAIASREEAQAYFAHPVLGPRLSECTRLVMQVEGRTVEQIFGYPDDLKFQSCMTLFAEVAPDSPLFRDALQKYFAGAPDDSTLDRL